MRAIKIAAAERDQTISDFMLACFHAYMNPASMHDHRFLSVGDGVSMLFENLLKGASLFGWFGWLGLPFSLYFIWKKIGQKVSASYTWRAGYFIAPAIGTITLINLKDSRLCPHHWYRAPQ